MRREIPGVTQVDEKGHEGNSNSHSLYMLEETWSKKQQDRSTTNRDIYKSREALNSVLCALVSIAIFVFTVCAIENSRKRTFPDASGV